MENRRTYKIYYANNYVCDITAYSIFEAVDKAFYKYVEQYPQLVRNLFIAI